jgi:cytosine deaminase
VAVASDNTRDPFYAYGDHDMHEVFREAVRILQLDHPIGSWADVVAGSPADIIGLPERGRLRVGAPADLVILEGRSWSEALSRPESRRTVLRAGKPIGTTPPAYAELDHLFT